MTKIAIVYGTSTGATEGVASQIKDSLGAGDMYDVARVTTQQLQPYELLILGTSTTGYGEILSDWEDFLPKLETLDFTGKKIALFGLGDSSSYSDTFANGMSELYKELKDKAEIVGETSAQGYTFDDSESEVDGKFVGLVIDEENESDQTATRIANWTAELKQYI